MNAELRNARIATAFRSFLIHSSSFVLFMGPTQLKVNPYINR